MGSDEGVLSEVRGFTPPMGGLYNILDVTTFSCLLIASPPCRTDRSAVAYRHPAIKSI